MDIASYADENAIGVVADDIISIIKSLKKASKTIFEYFKINFLKWNADKCQLLIICKENASIQQ